MSLPSLQTIALSQYIEEQDTENDPISQSVLADYFDIKNQARIMKNTSEEYRNYVKAQEALKLAEYLWKKFEKSIDEEKQDLETYVDDVAKDERKQMLESVDPNHENFNQCACGRLINKNSKHNCWVLNCKQNENFCKQCFKHEDGHERNCRFCQLPSCSTEHHLEHLKQCKPHAKKHICGYGDFEHLTERLREIHYKEREDISESDKQFLCYGMLDKQDPGVYCYKISTKVTECDRCGIHFCPECAGSSSEKRTGKFNDRTLNLCKSEGCQEEWPSSDTFVDIDEYYLFSSDESYN